MLGVGLLLTVGTGLFVASEFALVNLDRADLEARREAGESRLALTISALRITSTHLSSAQLGITLTTLLTGYAMEPAISNLLRPVFTSWGGPRALVTPLAVFIAVTIATILSMILGELIPKNFALAVPRQTGEAGDALPGRLHHGVPPRDLAPERQRQRRAAGARHRAQGGAVRRPHG